LKRQRENAGLTQEKLAEKAGIFPVFYNELLSVFTIYNIFGSFAGSGKLIIDT